MIFPLSSPARTGCNTDDVSLYPFVLYEYDEREFHAFRAAIADGPFGNTSVSLHEPLGSSALAIAISGPLILVYLSQHNQALVYSACSNCMLCYAIVTV